MARNSKNSGDATDNKPDVAQEPEPVVTSVEEANQPPEAPSAAPDHAPETASDESRPEPKPYRSSGDVYVDHIYVKAGDPFVTAEPKGDSWVEIQPDALPAIIASTQKVSPDSSLENLEVAALQAIAFIKNVTTSGIENDKDALMTAIKAAQEPSL